MYFNLHSHYTAQGMQLRAKLLQIYCIVEPSSVPVQVYTHTHAVFMYTEHLYMYGHMHVGIHMHMGDMNMCVRIK